MKEATKKLAKRAITKAVIGTNVGIKVKQEVEKKMNSYKKKIALLALELGFFVLGFNFLMLGIAGYLSKYFSEELVFFITGLILIIAGIILSRKIKNQSMLD